MIACLSLLRHSSPEGKPFHGREMLWFLCLDPRNLLDFALELRLAKSHRFADFCPNVETLPRGERKEGRGERGAEGRAERGKDEVHTDTHAVLCTCHNTAQHCDFCLSWSFHRRTGDSSFRDSPFTITTVCFQTTSHIIEKSFLELPVQQTRKTWIGTREDHNKISIYSKVG